MPLKYSYLGLIFEQAFYYHEHLRWSYGWATPNYAGAFLATIEPVIWVSAKVAHDKSRSKTINGFQFVAELVFWFLLARTYSRGSIVAAFFARATWQAVQGELTVIKTWVGYLVAPLVCILTSGLGGRLYYTVATVDPSVEHRLELWMAGLRMLAASPWIGWGTGKSGIVYMNWYESPDHTESFVSMVNSYLSLAVEHGLPAFCLVVFISAFLIYCGMSASKFAARDHRKLSALALGAATSVCAAWLAANISTNLWIVPSLWIVPGVAVSVLVGCRETWQAASMRKIAQCALLSLGTGWLLFSAGKALEGHSQVIVRYGGGGAITLESRINSPENKRLPAIDLWPDPLVLGEVPGRQLRAWLRQPDGPERLVIHTDVLDNDKTTQSQRVLVFVGRAVSRLQSIQLFPTDLIILLHPLPLSRGDLSPIRGCKAVVVIPEINQNGTNDAIKSEASELGAKILVSAGVGLDLRAAWPDIMKQAITAL